MIAGWVGVGVEGAQDTADLPVPVPGSSEQVAGVDRMMIPPGGTLGLQGKSGL